MKRQDQHISMMIFLFFILSLTTYSQPVTYALVIGISDYQDPEIPDLQFAHKDATIFAQYLQSKSGGALNKDQIKVLLNENATMGHIANALDWLWEVSKEGDKVIIYFSGHGDVEKKLITQPGYLLCWDAPPKVYMAGGAFSINILKDVIATLALENKTETLLITDACRSGVLSGSPINGTQITGDNLIKQYANETKILSCQPDEYSLEGKQWGGGRGAFSYHLVNGLFGLADENKDQVVELYEIRNYLEKNVSEQVAPQNQFPLTIGNRKQVISYVHPDELEMLLNSKSKEMPLFAGIDYRGIEDIVLSTLDEETKGI